MYTKIILSAMMMLSFHAPVKEDYSAVFGMDYQWANNWISSNAVMFEQTALAAELPAHELEAIVFPELIRYNTLFDAMEIQSLKFLYVSNGKSYADFSVGFFQMKPSFAEQVEKDAALLLNESTLIQLGLKGLSENPDNEESRRQRLERLVSKKGQLDYLAAFYKICMKKFDHIHLLNDAERIKFLATAYNSGYGLTKEKLLLMEEKKFFHTGKIFSQAKYNYAAIALSWFNKAM